MRARTVQDPGSGGLCPVAAARFCGMGRDSWDNLWKSQLAPAPSRPRPKLLLWSVHELSAWMAYGMPSLEQWRPIWSKMLEKGTWQAPLLLNFGGQDGSGAA